MALKVADNRVLYGAGQMWNLPFYYSLGPSLVTNDIKLFIGTDACDWAWDWSHYTCAWSTLWIWASNGWVSAPVLSVDELYVL